VLLESVVWKPVTDKCYGLLDAGFFLLGHASSLMLLVSSYGAKPGFDLPPPLGTQTGKG